MTTGDVGPRIPPIQRWAVAVQFFCRPKSFDLFRIDTMDQFSQSAFLGNVGKMFS